MKRIHFYCFFLAVSLILSSSTPVLVSAQNETVSKEQIHQKIELGKEYLLRTINPNEYGIYKYYYPSEDRFEERLYATYSASLVYTLLKIYEYDGDQRLPEVMKKITDFLFLMQNMDPESRAYGAFYYSFDLKTRKREPRFVVGTASKVIFTLLALYEKNKEEAYLNSAKLAGNWLLTMQKPDGSVKSALRFRDGKWFSIKKESLLYNGQTLSALSRLYKATGDTKYLEGARKIAEYLYKRIEREGCYLGDDYRRKNPISSSWVIMSFLDYYKASQETPYKNVLFRCSRALLERQIVDTGDERRYGRWRRAFSTSGNGWIIEVLAEIYDFCKAEAEGNCGEYIDAILRSTKWINARTYTDRNSSMLKNPERALGGIFWNNEKEYVRTDSVCHTLNAYIGIEQDLS